MEINIIVAGKPAISYVKEGVSFFEQRLRPLGKVNIQYLKAGSSEDVSARLLAASEGSLRIVLDERGEHWTTRMWESQFKKWQLHSVKRVALLIGAAGGHTQQLRDRADVLLCLGKHTMQHELALLVLLEQVYRIHTLLAGAPYHRD